jgi:arabinose-5-phosphate isomerase
MDGGESSSDWLALGREVLDVEMEGIAAVRDALGPDFVRAVTMLGECAGRVVVTGIGKSGLVGRKIAATFSSTGTPAAFLHPVEGAHGDMGMIRPGDVVLAISNSGETDELNAILPSLKALGALVVAMTGDVESTLGRMSEAVINTHVPREACPLNMAPTASTTAALALGDALAVCLIELKEFSRDDFKRCHPGGALGSRLQRPVTELMHTQDLPACRGETPLDEALSVMNAGGLGFLAVLEADETLAGVVTDGDLRRLLSQGPLERRAPVSAVMIRDPKRLSADKTGAQALDLMEARQITVLPVVDQQDRLKGMIHLHDLLGKGRFRFSG